MPLYEIEHRWSPNVTNAVVEKVGQAVELAKKGQVPAGFRPISIVALPGKTEAHCLWEAPSADKLEAMYASFSLPTQRTIREVNAFFTR
jgi:hypothetical protein